MFRQIDHVALVVANLDEAVELYQRQFGVECYLRERNEEQGFEVAAFAVGDGHIELLAPTRPDSVIASFLEKRGPGLHHVALQVDNIDQRLAEMEAGGLRLIDHSPRRGTGESRIAFIHPKSTLGTMLELVEPAQL
jgi:methylmalonyl-CoA/ethylmalonyl-CoA epimerase